MHMHQQEKAGGTVAVDDVEVDVHMPHELAVTMQAKERCISCTMRIYNAIKHLCYAQAA